MLRFVEFGQKTYRLHMSRKRKHIISPAPFGLVSVFFEPRHVSCECFRVAGNVDDAVRCKADNGGEEGFIASGTRRIHKYDICVLARFCHFGHKYASVVLIKGNVFCLIHFGISVGIAHGIRVQFHADDLPGFLCCHQPDGSDSAVGIDHALFSGQIGQLDRFSVKELGLHRIDLIKGFRRNAESSAAQFILNVTFSVEYSFFFSEHHACLLVVDVQYNRCDFRVQL